MEINKTENFIRDVSEFEFTVEQSKRESYQTGVFDALKDEIHEGDIVRVDGIEVSPKAMCIFREGAFWLAYEDGELDLLHDLSGSSNNVMQIVNRGT